MFDWGLDQPRMVNTPPRMVNKFQRGPTGSDTVRTPAHASLPQRMRANNPYQISPTPPQRCMPCCFSINTTSALFGVTVESSLSSVFSSGPEVPGAHRRAEAETFLREETKEAQEPGKLIEGQEGKTEGVKARSKNVVYANTQARSADRLGLFSVPIYDIGLHFFLDRPMI